MSKGFGDDDNTPQHLKERPNEKSRSNDDLQKMTNTSRTNNVSYNLWFLMVAIGMVFRIVIAMYQPHSGKSNPPIYGDFEAQRHWIEVTKNLPISNWYFYDLQYWGLDYPPLTAFHHYLMGKFSDVFGVCRGCFDFFKSRGNQSADMVMFMRISVLLMDLLIYIPACYLIFKKSSFKRENSMNYL